MFIQKFREMFNRREEKGYSTEYGYRGSLQSNNQDLRCFTLGIGLEPVYSQ